MDTLKQLPCVMADLFEHCFVFWRSLVQIRALKTVILSFFFIFLSPSK